MQVIEIIEKKRDNRPLLKKELNFLIDSFLDGFVPDYQMSAFLMAVYIHGMNEEETSWLTDLMLHSGKVIEHPYHQRPLVDKHSTGGVGDKISIALAPAVAACGISVPMISGRGLGHTGGTLDKLESIPGFSCDLSIEEFQNQVASIGCAIIGQTKDIAPADKRLYALRDVTGTVASIPLIASSIMSKKMAEGLDALVLDVKFGSGAFMADLTRAKSLAQTMVGIGSRLGKKVTACLTNMDQPLGVMIGNALEIKESIDILKGKGPSDSLALTLELGAEMLILGNKASSHEEGKNLVKDALTSGRAFDVFVRMVKAQGGDISYVLEPDRFSKAKHCISINAATTGFVQSIDSRAIGIAVGMLGGGRFTLNDTIAPEVGAELKIKIGDQVLEGQPICMIHADQRGLDEALLRISHAITIASDPVPSPVLCAGRISTIH